MPSTMIPGVGVQAKWAEGEDGWGLGMDENLVRLSVLTQLSVPSATSPLSASGGVQIAPPSHAKSGQIAVSLEGTWWFYQPFVGMSAWVRDAAAWFVWDGSAWVREASAAYVISPVVSGSRAITEAEFAAGATIEVSSEQDVVLTVPGPSVSAPQMGASTARRPVTVVRTGNGRVSVAAAAGSTILSADNAMEARAWASPFAIIPISGDRYVVSGDMQ